MSRSYFRIREFFSKFHFFMHISLGIVHKSRDGGEERSQFLEKTSRKRHEGWRSEIFKTHKERFWHFWIRPIDKFIRPIRPIHLVRKWKFETFFIKVYFSIQMRYAGDLGMKNYLLDQVNNAFLIFDDMGRKSGKIWESWGFFFLSWKSFFFSFKNRKSMSRCEKPWLWAESPCPERISKIIVLWLEKRKNEKKKNYGIFYISDFFMLFFICRMKNPRSFVISNQGQRTRFHFDFLDLEDGRKKSLRVSSRSESY